MYVRASIDVCKIRFARSVTLSAMDERGNITMRGEEVGVMRTRRNCRQRKNNFGYQAESNNEMRDKICDNQVAEWASLNSLVAVECNNEHMLIGMNEEGEDLHSMAQKDEF